MDKKIGQFAPFDPKTQHTLKYDEGILKEYVENKGFVFIRDKPAIEILQYKDYMMRKDSNRENERAHCPFATAKKAIWTKKRGFVYPIGSNISKLFDAECVICVRIA